MTDQADKATQFLALHRKGAPLLLPNPWDIGSAKLFASLGFSALATTSMGYARSQGRRDGTVDRDQVLAHCADIVAATPLPVSADLENCFGNEPSEVAATVDLVRVTGVAGCSVEDYDPRAGDPIYDAGLAAERVAAAAAAAHSGDARLVLTARAENLFRGRLDLPDTIARLQAFQEAGADVLYAPGPTDLADIRTIVNSVDRPVNVLARPHGPTVAELADAGVARISVGAAFAFAAWGAVAEAARELLGSGTYGFWSQSAAGSAAAAAAIDG